MRTEPRGAPRQRRGGDSGRIGPGTRHHGAHRNLAWALYLLGRRFDEADQEIRQVTEAYRRRFGPDHPTALSAQQLHSRTRAELGHVEAGAELMTDVVARRENSLGPDHPFMVAGRELLSAFTSGRWRPPGAEG
ncbi:tetratricopeptide repeat protein [Streptomyces sp. NPDC057298]|uniref:tetratricopeptide repeat protein n=1 Tax=Streptomyces sp. NPDC057298 TaxID=3346091 RepID=UPI0036343E33